MNEKLKKYIDYIFENAPKTKEALDLKEELTADLTEKYNDLLAEGKSEDEAYHAALSGLGDINELIGRLKPSPMYPSYTPEQIEKDRKRTAVYTSIAVALYIISPVFLIGFEEVLHMEYVGLFSMFFLVAAATIMLIYCNMTKLPNIKAENSVVEDFKEWKYQSDSKYQTMKAINSAISSVTLAVYFIYSFSTGAWHISWVIFLIGGALKSIVKSIFEMTR